MTPALVLAGGRAKPDLQALTGQSNRALVAVNGKTLLRHVIDALNAAGTSPITVIGDVPADPDYACLPDSGDFVANVFAGLEACSGAPYVLISTADLPFLTGAAAADFTAAAIALAEQSGAGLIWPVVPVSACYARFPQIRRTALRLREGEFTGGNLALVRPEFLLAHRERIAGAYAARKSPARLALMLGVGTVLRVLGAQKLTPRLLSLSYLEARVSLLMGGSTRALVCDHVEIATDLDRPSDFVAVGMGR